MTTTMELTRPHDIAVPLDAQEAGAMVAELRQQMAALEKQLADVSRQQAALLLTLDQIRGRLPQGEQIEEPSGVNRPLLQRCAGDILRVLREIGRPLVEAPSRSFLNALGCE